MFSRSIPQSKKSLLGHSIVSGYFVTTRRFAIAPARASTGGRKLRTTGDIKTATKINNLEVLIPNYQVKGLTGNSYSYRLQDILGARERVGIGMATYTTTAKDAAGERFSVGSKVELANGVLMPKCWNACVLWQSTVSDTKIHFGVYEVDPGKECETAVRNALEAGYRGIDSAQWYHNEASCGKAIKAFLSAHPELTREDIFFTTKLQKNVSYDDTRRTIKSSIEKTGLGYIDLYLLHSPYGGKQTRAECWRAVADAVEAEEVRAGGVSNFGVRHMRELIDEEREGRRPVVNQIEVHPFNTNTEITTFCRENGIQIQAYAPLVKGLMFNHPVIKELSEKYGCTPAQLLVRWSLQMGYVPLPKSVRRDRIEENKNVEGIEISGEDMKGLEGLEGLDGKLVTDWDPTNAP